MKKAIATGALAFAIAMAGFGCAQPASSESGTHQSQSASAQSVDKRAMQKEFDAGMIGASVFQKTVNKDNTGKWRCYVYSSDKPAQEIAADYWRAYAESDDEVHALVNLGLKTSANVTKGGGMLYVDVHEYVEGEEHDAAKMFSGALLARYEVDPSTRAATQL